MRRFKIRDRQTDTESREFWWQTPAFLKLLVAAQIPVVLLRAKKRFPTVVSGMKFIFRDSNERWRELGSAYGQEALPMNTEAGVLVFSEIPSLFSEPADERWRRRENVDKRGWLFPSGVWTDGKFFSYEKGLGKINIGLGVKTTTKLEAESILRSWMRISSILRSGTHDEILLAWIAYVFASESGEIPMFPLSRRAVECIKESLEACGTVSPSHFAMKMLRKKPSLTYAGSADAE